MNVVINQIIHTVDMVWLQSVIMILFDPRSTYPWDMIETLNRYVDFDTNL